MHLYGANLREDAARHDLDLVALMYLAVDRRAGDDGAKAGDVKGPVHRQEEGSLTALGAGLFRHLLQSSFEFLNTLTSEGRDGDDGFVREEGAC